MSNGIEETTRCVNPHSECPRGRRGICVPNRCSGCEWGEVITYDKYLRDEVASIKSDIQEIKKLLEGIKEV